MNAILTERRNEVVALQPIKSPVIWFGGKSKLATTIHRYMPPHKTFVDLFGGSGNMTSQKEPTGIEVYNDIDEEMVNFLMVLRKDAKKLAKHLDSMPYSRQLFDEMKWQEPPKDKFERAVRFFYLNRSSVSAGNNHKSGWRHGATVNPARDYHSAIEILEQFAERMKYVQIENRDFREIIRVYDTPDTLFYCDPPYVGNERRYKGGFRKQDHIELADRLEGIQGKAMVSYYADELIDHLYNGWRRIEIKAHQFSQVLRGGEERPERTELLLMNWDDPQLTIFDMAVGE